MGEESKQEDWEGKGGAKKGFEGDSGEVLRGFSRPIGGSRSRLPEVRGRRKNGDQPRGGAMR